MKNIVILGAGFGGLRAAMKLGKEVRHGKLGDHKVILIDKNEYHTYTPTLYEISATSKEVANYIDLKAVNTFPVKKLIGKRPIEFMKAEVVKIDVKKGNVHLDDGRRISYDHLIIALGAQSNFFDIPGLEENALDLKTFNDAVRIRDAVWTAVTGAEANEEISIVIGGAGATGVEVAGEVQKWVAQLKSEGYNCKTKTTIINRNETILKGFDNTIVKKATRRLKKLGTEIMTGETIESATKDHVHLKSGEDIPFNILIWTGGVKANKLANTIPFKTDKQDRFEVVNQMLCISEESDLRISGKIYGIGDIVCTFNPRTGTSVPGVARAAISQGSVVAKNIARDIKGEKHITYKAINYPYIIAIGGKYAIAKVGPIVISGFLGWLLKGLVELNYLASIMPKDEAFKIWLKGLKIFIQNDRLG